MDIRASIKNLPVWDEKCNIYAVSEEWCENTFPDSMDPHPEYKLMASPTIDELCNWDSFKILCKIFFVEGYTCAGKGLTYEEEIEHYKKFCSEKKQNEESPTNKFSFGAGLYYYKTKKKK